MSQKRRKYPENIYLKGAVAVSGRTITELAETLGTQRVVLSNILNGNNKGERIVGLLKRELNLEN